MTKLDKLIATAYASNGKQADVNKVYLGLLQTLLLLPVQKEYISAPEEPFAPLFAKIEGQHYMLIFDTLERLQAWAGEQIDQINYVEISGHDLIAGIHDSVFLCLNLGSEFYKEFPPEEVKRLKTIVARIGQISD